MSQAFVVEHLDQLQVRSMCHCLRIRHLTCTARQQARQDEPEDIAMVYTPLRKQVRNGMLPPAEFERQQILAAEGVRKPGAGQMMLPLTP